MRPLILVFLRVAATMGLVSSLWGFDPITDESGIYVVVWERGPVPVQNNLPNSVVFSDGTTFRGSMDAAVSRWNPWLGNVQFSLSHGTEGSYANGNDTSEFALDSTIGGFEFGSSTLAVTVSFTDGGNLRVESDIVFNDKWDWDSYRGDLRPVELDVRRVAIHELGHVLGLDHPDQAGQSVTAVMNSTVSDIDDLQQDDVDGAQFLYGAANSPPPNDDFANAIPVDFAGEAHYTFSGTNVQSTSEPGEPVLDSLDPGGRSVWWRIASLTPGTVHVTTAGSRFDTVVGVFQGDALGGLAEVAINDDVDPGIVRTSALTFEAQPDTNYYVMVDGWDGLEGAIELNVSLFPQLGPYASIGSRRIVGTPGESRVISVVASGLEGGALSYQWMRDGRPISGATTDSLTLPAFANADAGVYTVAVTEAGLGTTYESVFVQPKYDSTEIVAWGGDPLDPLLQVPVATSPIVQLAAGNYHGLALTEDGAVHAWGSPPSPYDLGQNTPPPLLRNVVAIAAGSHHSLALRMDGTVVAWGSNSAGESTVPLGLRDVISVAAGFQFSLALRADGTVVRWGTDHFGDLVVPEGLAEVVAISAGGDSAAAVHLDGSVTVWGTRDNGRTEYPVMPSIKDLDVSASHSLALGEDGEIFAWGSGSYGALNVPPGLRGVAAVETGYFFSMALRMDGSLVGWGDSREGQVDVPSGLDRVVAIESGRGSTFALRNLSAARPPVIRVQPVESIVIAEADEVVLAVEVWGDDPFTYVWKKDGVELSPDRRFIGLGSPRLKIIDTVESDFGSYTVEVTNAAGTVVSDGALLSIAPLPAIQSAPRSQVALVGDSVTMTVAASDAGDLAYQWWHGEDQIPGATEDTLHLPSVTLGDAGRYEVQVISAIGSVRRQCFLRVARPEATAVWQELPSSLSQTPLPGGLSGVVKVEAEGYAMALLADGSLAAWGRSNYGVTFIPEELGPVVDFALEETAACALRADGTVTTWGQDIGMPPDLVDVVAIDSRGALLADGTVRTWGGVGSPPDGLKDVVQISIGSQICAARRRDGTVVAWGSASPLVVPPEAISATWIGAGRSTVLVRRPDGSFYLWRGSPSQALVFSELQDVDIFTHGRYGGAALLSDGTFTRWHEDGGSREDEYRYFDETPVQIWVGVPDAAVVLAEAPSAVEIAGMVDLNALETLQLTVSVAGGTGPFAYNWFRDGELLDLSERVTVANDGTLTIDPADPSDSGTYRVEVRNGAGTLSTEALAVLVRDRPALVQPLTHRHVAAGDRVVLDATAVGPGVTYQWYRDGEVIVDATAAVLEFAAIALEDAGRYMVMMTAPSGGQRRVSFEVTVVEADLMVAMWGGHTLGFDEVPPGITDVVQVSSYTGHTLALTRHGQVLGWGYNDVGQLDVPATLQDPVEVSAGYGFSMVLDARGHVTIWGTDRYGADVVPPNLPRVKSISAGNSLSAVVTIDGEVYAWGRYFDEGLEPLDLPPAFAVSASSGGDLMVLLADGTVRVFEEGRDTTEYRVPEDLTDVVQVAAGSTSQFALTSAGEVVHWGVDWGALPDPPAGLSNVTAIAIGNEHALALRSDGSVVAWGNDRFGQVSTPENLPAVRFIEVSSSASLALVPYPEEQLAIVEHPRSVSALGGSPVTLRVAGRAGEGALSYQWLRDGSPLVDGNLVSGTQTAELTIHSASEIFDGRYSVEVSDARESLHSLSVLVRTEVSGDLPTFTSRPLSRQVTQGDTVSITAELVGASQYAWRRQHEFIPGANGPTLTIPSVGLADEGFYELCVAGEGGRVSTSVFHLQVVPTRVELLAIHDDEGLSVPADVGEVAGIHVGHNQAFVVRADGTVKGWGTNSSGAIEAAESLANVVHFDVFHTEYAAVLADGTAITSNPAWNAELADLGISDFVAATTGNNHALFLRTDGSLAGVGGNASGESTSPVDLGPVIGLSAAGSASLALQNDGTVVVWGSNFGGIEDIPDDLDGVVAVGMGFRYGLAQGGDGRLRLWGYSYEIPDLPEEAGPVVDFDTTFYELGLIDQHGVASVYNSIGLIPLPEDWTSMKRIAVGSGIRLGLRSTARPVIDRPPSGLIISAGEEAVLSVEATGTGALRYQWSRDGVHLIDGPGVTGTQTAQLTIQSATAGDYGAYTVTISDNEGVTTSEPVLLQFRLPQILAQPEHRAAFGGQNVTLAIQAVSPTPLTYQWYRGVAGDTALPIPGATGPELTLADGAIVGTAWVRVANAMGYTDSESVHLLTFKTSESQIAGGRLFGAAYGNGHFLVTGWGKFALSSDLESWQEAPGSASSRTDIAFGHGLFVRGGGSTTTVINVSEDGLSWTPANSYAAGSIIRDIAFNGTRFVAVSDVAGYSDDGRNWMTGAGFSAEAVVWGGDRFVAVGIDVVRVSMDGITWQTGQAPSGVWFREIVYGDGVYVATSSDNSGVKIWYSADGYDWQEAHEPSPSGFSGDEIRLSYGNGLFVGVPYDSNRYSSQIFLSSDGQRWSASVATYNDATDIVFGGDRFLISGFNGHYHASDPLPNSVTIERITPSSFVIGGEETELFVEPSDPAASIQWYRGFSGDVSEPVEGGNAPTLTVSIEENTQFWVRVVNAVTSRDSETITLTVAEPPEFIQPPVSLEAVRGDRVSLRAVVSADPEASYQWYLGLSGDTSRPIAGAASADLSLLVEEGQKTYWLRATNLAGSADSGSVTVTSWDQLINWGDLRVFGELNGELTGVAHTGVLRSPRGISWQFEPVAEFPSIRSVAFGAERYVALTQYGSGLRVSEDLLAWSELSLPPGFVAGDLFDVVYAWDAFWICTNQTNLALRSVDGLTWEVVSLGSSVADVSIASWYFDGQRLLGVGGDSRSQSVAIVYSLDGAVWQRADLPGQVSSDQSIRALDSIDRAQGRYYAWSDTLGLMLTSLDGETWSSLDTVAAGLDQMRPVGFAELGRYAVTADSGTMRVSLDGLNWTEISSYEALGLRPHGLLSLPGRLLVESDGGIWETTDLVNWTLRARHPSRTNSFRDVVVGAGLYVTSVFRDGDSYSTDGKIWQAMGDPITPRGVGGVLAYGDGLFLASDPGDIGAYWYSSNGSDWTAANIAEFDDAINELIFLNGQWFALGIDGLFARSPDGVNWTLGSVAGAAGFHYALAFGNGRYVISAGRDIWWSSDLVSWTAGPTLNVPGLALTFGQERFVVVGGANDGQILTSSDGEEWTQRFVMSNNGMYDVTNDGDRFYAATAEGILVSEDALSWRWSQLPAATSVRAEGEQVVAAGGTVLVRADTQPRSVSFRQELIAGPASEGRILAIIADVSGDYASLQWVFKGEPMVDGPRISGATTQSLLVDSITQDDAGEYELIVTDLSGATISQSVSVVVTSMPQIVAQPVGASLAPGEGITLTVSATGGALRYQWFLNGNAIDEASDASLELPSVTFADGGRYEVMVFNSSGEELSESAFVSVLPSGVSLTGVHTLQGERFVPGGEVEITNQLDWSGDITGLTVSVLLPEGWTLIDTEAGSADVVPDPGDELLLEWTWHQLPSSPLEFSYRLAVPADSRAPVNIEGVVSIGVGQDTSLVLLTPDPLVVRPALHSADTDGDSRLQLSELLRVIELYNTRSGTSRTGRYGLSETTEDSFRPDYRPVDEGNSPARFHSADVNRDGRIGLSELLRVIELYNTRSGTSRTGAYRIDATTEDGFAPDA